MTDILFCTQRISVPLILRTPPWSVQIPISGTRGPRCKWAKHTPKVVSPWLTAEQEPREYISTRRSFYHGTGSLIEVSELEQVLKRHFLSSVSSWGGVPPSAVTRRETPVIGWCLSWNWGAGTLKQGQLCFLPPCSALISPGGEGLDVQRGK